MRICYFADGKSFHTIRWCEHFYSLGHEIHLITFSAVEIPNVQVHVVNSGDVKVTGGNWKLIKNYRRVKDLVKTINPDIFHALYATSYGVTGALSKHKNYIITALGSDLLLSPQKSFLYRLAIRFAFRRARWITVMSQQMSDVARDLGTDMSKVAIVPFGVNPDVFNANQRKLPENEFVVTSTRNLEKVYNIPHFLKALALVKDKIPNLKVNLMGFGSLEKELKKMTVDLGISDFITFWGRVNQSQIATTLNNSHVFVSVSLSDGNNISLNEAMACDAFCIATNIPANRQWIEDGVNGFLVEIDDVEGLADRILQAYSNYQLLHDKASPINKKIIEEKGIWANNMEVVEKKYQEMVNH